MGCDIHLYCEYKPKNGKRNNWISGDYFKVNQNYEVYDDESKMTIIKLYDGRWYELFAILADVRNYSNNTPISQPKGIPDDSCGFIKTEYDEWSCDAHSASYFTLRELLDAGPNYKISKRSGMISAKQYEDLQNGIKPQSWCQWTNAENHVQAEWEDDVDVLDAIIKPLTERARELFKIWDFYKDEDAKEKINEIANDIRVVFWFDN